MNFRSAQERREYYASQPGALYSLRLANARSVALYRARNPSWNTTPQYRVSGLVHQRIYRSGYKSLASISELLGVAVVEFVKYIEAQFREGMTWDNWGTVWQLDHIKPLRLFDLSTLKGQKAAHHFSNWRPLLIAEHRAKTARECSINRS